MRTADEKNKKWKKGCLSAIAQQSGIHKYNYNVKITYKFVFYNISNNVLWRLQNNVRKRSIYTPRQKKRSKYLVVF